MIIWSQTMGVKWSYLPGSLQILVISFFLFGNLGCVVFFFLMVSVCKVRQARLLKNVNKHIRYNFHIFVTSLAKTNEKRKNGMKSSNNSQKFYTLSMISPFILLKREGNRKHHHHHDNMVMLPLLWTSVGMYAMHHYQTVTTLLF